MFYVSIVMYPFKFSHVLPLKMKSMVAIHSLS